MSDSIPGFRFYPTEEELISFYLVNKLQGIREDVLDLVIPVLNIYDFLPSDLQQYSGVKCRGDPEQCFFFIPRQESEARGGRPSRLTETGYWKATGSPSYVYSSDSGIIGLKRTMVFYTGRAPQGNKTQWKMNEYKAIQLDHASPSSSSSPTLRQEYSLCRVYKKTKCIRAFDRRPTRVHETDFPKMDNIFHHHDHQQLAHHQYDHAKANSMIMNSTTTTHDGSTANSSPENHRSGGTGPAGDSEAEAARDEGLWVDWDNAWRFMEEEK